MPRVPTRLTEYARKLRNGATPAERAIWARLSCYRPRFTRQLRVGDYIIDLACRGAKVGIEFDGSQHHDQLAYDTARTRFLGTLGWQIVRLWNSDVPAKPDGAARHIVEVIAQRTATHPQPLPSREGRARRPRIDKESP